jgi:hypothetical protein
MNFSYVLGYDVKLKEDLKKITNEHIKHTYCNIGMFLKQLSEEISESKKKYDTSLSVLVISNMMEVLAYNSEYGLNDNLILLTKFDEWYDMYEQKIKKQ